MELVWKAAALSVAAALLGLLLQKTGPAHTLLLGLAAAAAVLALTLGIFRELRDTFGELCREAGIGTALTFPVLKSLGIAVVGRGSAELCRDAGQSAAASAKNMASTGFRPFRIGGWLDALLFAIPVQAPFLDIPVHVVQSPSVGKMQPDRAGNFPIVA